MQIDLPSALAVLAIIAALVGLIPNECNDPNCRNVHKQHKQRDAEQKALAFHRGNHRTYDDPTCRHCVERKSAGYK